MKIQVFDRFRSGLILLAILAIAVVAGQARPNAEEPVPTEDAFELDAGLRIEIDHEQLDKLQSLSSVIEPVLELPVRVEFSTDESVAPDIADPDTAPVQ